ncbi:MAG: WG repeat-containing protein [Clostridia bacterium]|nr:WG repeat-containing protein [Clostridia bacterium]
MKKTYLIAALAVLVVISTVAIVLIPTGNSPTNRVIAPAYEEALPFHDGYAVVKLNGKYGAINEQGEMVVEPAYAWLGLFNEGYAAAINDAGEMQIVSTDGSAITPTYAWHGTDWLPNEYGEVVPTHVSGTSPVSCTVERAEQNLTDYVCMEGVINLGGVPFRTDGTPVKAEMGLNDAMAGPCVNGIVPIRWVNDAGPIGVTFYRKSGESLGDVVYGYLNMPYAYAPKDGRIVFAVEGMYDGALKTGLMDENQTVILEPTYDNYRYWSDGTFFEDGLMIVIKGEKYGAINLDGAEVIPCTYDFLGDFSDGYCFAVENGKGFFIDPQANRYAIGGIDGEEVNITAAAYFNAKGVGVVYDSISDRAYCIRNILTDGAFTAIPGTEKLDIRSFVPDYVEGGEIGAVSGIADNCLFPYEKDGKWGYMRLIVED